MAGSGPGYAKHPDHRVAVAGHAGRVRVYFNGKAVADSRCTLVVRESGYGPVHYFPRADVRMDLLAPSRRRSRCPFKGEARYWRLGVGGRTVADAVWAYPDPYDEVAAIAGCVAFDVASMESVEFGD